jgi:hypothetical protein
MKREARKFVLDDLRGHVLAAAGLEHLLLAVGDAQEAVLREFADVAGVQPALRGRAFPRSFRLR